MSTKNFVPRANNEGGIGTEAKQWGSVWSKNMYVDGTNVKDKLTTLEQNLGTLNTAITTKAITFNSVALMKEAPLEPGMVAMTTGYHNPNDGGAGVYTIRTKLDSDVDDGGSIIFLDNGNVAELINDGTVNVKQFGAKGDGVTDDKNAFIKCIAYAKSKGLTISVDSSNYYLSRPVVTDKSIVDSDNGTYPNEKFVYSDSTKFSKINGAMECISAKLPTDYVTPDGSVTYWLQSVGYNSDKDTVLLTFAGYLNGVNDQPGKLVEVSSDFKTVLKTVTYDVGHGNGTCYNPDTKKWYIAPGLFNGILVFDDELNYIETILSDTAFWTAAYDEDAKLFYAQSGNTGTPITAVLHIFDTDFVEVKQVNLPQVFEPDGTTLMISQDATVINGQYAFLYYSTKYISITIYDYETGKITNQAFFSNKFNQEPEGMFVKDGFVYVVSIGYVVEVQRFLANNVSCSELLGQSFYHGIFENTEHSIPANADLNDYFAYGKYYCPNMATATTLQNCPVSWSGFVLYVINNGNERFTQLIIDNLGTIYSRNGKLDSKKFFAWQSDIIYPGYSYNTDSLKTLAGFVTNSGSFVEFDIQIPKTNPYGVSLKSVTGGGVVIRGLYIDNSVLVSGYLNSGGSAGNSINDYSPAYVVKAGGNVHVTLTGTWAGGNVANNSPCTIEIGGLTLNF